MSLSFIIFVMTTNCSKYNTSLKKDCLEYMRNCTFNESIIGTTDAKTGRFVTLESRFEDCTEWWNYQL